MVYTYVRACSIHLIQWSSVVAEELTSLVNSFLLRNTVRWYDLEERQGIYCTLLVRMLNWEGSVFFCVHTFLLDPESEPVGRAICGNSRVLVRTTTLKNQSIEN
jgi:hypothetical protein